MTVIIECISSKFEEAKGEIKPRRRTNNTMTKRIKRQVYEKI